MLMSSYQPLSENDGEGESTPLAKKAEDSDFDNFGNTHPKLKNLITQKLQEYNTPDDFNKFLENLLADEDYSSLSATEKENLIAEANTHYANLLKEQWLAFLNGEKVTAPGTNVFPPKNLLDEPNTDQEQKKHELSSTKKKYLKNLWKINRNNLKTDQDKEDFLNNFSQSFRINYQPSNTERFFKTLSNISLYLSLIGNSILLILGTNYVLESFAGASAGVSITGFCLGGILTMGVISKTKVGIDYKTKTNEELAKSSLLRNLMTTTLISFIVLTLFLGVAITQLDNVISGGAPFGLAGGAAEIFTYTLVGLSAVIGLSTCATNFSMFRSVQRKIRGIEEDSRIDKIIKHPLFKGANIGLNFTGSTCGVLFIAIMVSNVIPPFGLGFAIGAVIGIATLIQKHLTAINKLGVPPKSTSYHPLDWLYLKLSKHQRAMKAFNLTVAVLMSAGLFLSPYIVLPEIAKAMAINIPTIAALTTGIVLGVSSFFSVLYPNYKKNREIITDAREMKELSKELCALEQEHQAEEQATLGSKKTNSRKRAKSCNDLDNQPWHDTPAKNGPLAAYRQSCPHLNFFEPRDLKDPPVTNGDGEEEGASLGKC